MKLTEKRKKFKLALILKGNTVSYKDYVYSSDLGTAKEGDRAYSKKWRDYYVYKRYENKKKEPLAWCSVSSKNFYDINYPPEPK